MFVPAATPAPVINVLYGAAAKALKSKDVSERLSNEAAEIVASTPREFAEFVKIEINKWAAVIRKAQVRLEAL
jgi:tripartite-type tricarboxylate transporter receptor subunit TctC